MAGSLFPAQSQAQQVYRIVGPDGKVTFSDQPPPPSSNARVSATSAGSAGGPATASLPFELRQVAAKYPVTLYSGDNCGPCGAARSLLTSRGIPFAEKTVSTNEDAQALQRLSGDNSLPFLTIGAQQLKGFSDAEWDQFLDAAGYPKTSRLPSGYRQPAAAPLVAVQRPAEATVPAVNASPAPGRPMPEPAASPNPAGIRF
nr:glutaredoxin family protein [Polaromonas jejuensis]